MGNFDLFRITKGKREVDISTSTLREYVKQGLALYKKGKAAFISKAELEAFIRAGKKAA